MRSSASSRVKAPQERNMSTKHTAMHPSTLRIRLARFFVVTCSTPRAKSKILVSLKCFLAYSLMITTRLSGLARDLIRCPMPMMSWLPFFMLSTKSFGLVPLSCADENIFAASSRAPPKRGPIVRSPLQSDETKSLPAREETIVLCAPLTAGPWSAVTIKTMSMKFVHSAGSCLRNQRSESTPPTPMSLSKQSEMDTPQYFSSSPRSSAMDEMKFAGFRTMPSFFAQV
mmetsp:Transcript_64000/g.177903  ORF Transcript_64000/g.177903 Transcript_64000/m.177903 type:complete len:228 (-) Transcript_64000:442-1125(-)